ncbi:MAG: MotA/TolQ/ExbB proton channel family protein, partial [SAR324 cluster bacterium]
MWSYLSTANWFALTILGLLILMSALSWAIIVLKTLQFRQVAAENDYFMQALAREQALASLYSLSQNLDSSPLARLFESGYREISAFRQRIEKAPVPDARERFLDTLGRTLERIYNQQTQLLERRLPVLATVSSSAP